MNKRLIKILEIGCSGLIGVIFTISYQHFFEKAPQTLTVIINGEEAIITKADYSELYNQKSDLENELIDIVQELSETKSKLIQSENELSIAYNELFSIKDEFKVLSNSIPKYEFFDIGINIDGVNKNNFAKGYLDIDGRKFILLSVLDEIIDKDINYENNILYVGHSTAEKVKLMDVCPPYDFSDRAGYSTVPFKMNGEQYNGFSMGMNGTRYALINLKNNFSNLEFNFGHIDGASNYSCTLNIYLDGELIKSIDKQPDSAVSHESIPLNYAGHLKLEFVCGYSSGGYGLGDIYLQY